MPHEPRVILLDLNGCMVEWSPVPAYVAPAIGQERYRLWLARLMERHQERGDIVAMVTIRPAEFRDQTLLAIRAATGFTPDEAHFRDRPMKAPVWKRHVLLDRIQPSHGSDPRRYVAIESNDQTAEMYEQLGVVRHRPYELRQALLMPAQQLAMGEGDDLNARAGRML